MGAVYRARHLTFDIDVAVKVMVPTLGADPELLRGRFLREARASAILDHPNILRVYDVDQAGPYAFMVMEYVEGESLGGLLRRRRTLEPKEALDLILPVCQALGEAHRRNILHRDVKPDNILVRASDGRVKVADMGLAKFLATDDPQQFTRTLEGLGSPSFMAPEQVRSARDVDRRADVYSVCATLYTLLTGRPPFVGNSVSEIVAAVLRDPVQDPRRLRPDLPGALATILVLGLDKDPARRPASCEELARELVEALAPAPPVPPRQPLPSARPAAAPAAPTFRRVVELASADLWKARPQNLRAVSWESYAAAAPPFGAGHERLLGDALGLYALAEEDGPGSQLPATRALEVVGTFAQKAGGQTDITWPYGLDTNLSFDGNILRTGLMLANKRLWKLGDGSRAGMSAVLMQRDGPATLATLGPGGCLLIREGRLAFLGTAGRAAGPGLGSSDRVDPEIHDGHCRPGDVLMLCSRDLHAALGRQLQGGGIEGGVGLVVTLMATANGPLEGRGSTLLAEAARLRLGERVSFLLIRCAAASG